MKGRVFKDNLRSIVTLCILVFGFLLLIQPGRSVGWDVTEEEKHAYLQSLEESQLATQSKVFRELIAIVPESDPVNRKRFCGSDLIWEGEPGNSRILVATFMDRWAYEHFYQSHMGKLSYDLTKSLWVTVVPELKNYFARGCRKDSPPKAERCPPSAKRIAQLLGLRPSKDYDVLLEFWVDPKDLFRPSADPEITDHEAEPATKDAEGIWAFRSVPFHKYDDEALFFESPGDTPVPFRQWYGARADTIYAVQDWNDPKKWGWPWTRLGYTYDWGSPRNHIGTSEFVIRIDVVTGRTLVRLERAIDSASPEWARYFQCHRPSSSVGVTNAAQTCR